MRHLPILPVLRHSDHGDPGLVGAALRRLRTPFRILDVHAGAPLPDPRRIPGAVVLGGSMAPWDDRGHPWLRAEVRFVERCLAAGAPLLGVCLGAQLIARAAGARTFRAPRPEIGWFRLLRTAAGRTDPLLGGRSAALFAAHWHWDAFALPAGAVRLAEATPAGEQAFRFGEAWGTQFHFEITPAIARRWAARGRESGEIGPRTARALVEGERRRRAALRGLAAGIVGGFAARLRR